MVDSVDSNSLEFLERKYFGEKGILKRKPNKSRSPNKIKNEPL